MLILFQLFSDELQHSYWYQSDQIRAEQIGAKCNGACYALGWKDEARQAVSDPPRSHDCESVILLGPHVISIIITVCIGDTKYVDENLFSRGWMGIYNRTITVVDLGFTYAQAMFQH
jgi:hypothetical protein